MCFGSIICLGYLSIIVETDDCDLCLCGGEFRDSIVSQLSVRFIMITDDSSEDEISSTEEFEVALGRVLCDALENGVDPRGTWEYRTEGTDSDMEVLVVELAD